MGTRKLGAQGFDNLRFCIILTAVLSLILTIQAVSAVAQGNAANGSAPPEAALAARARALNNSVLQLHGQMQDASPNGADAIRGQAGPVFAQRAAALTKLIQTDPRAALTFAFSPELLADLAAKFPQSATLLESHATAQGQVERWIEDSADLKTSRSYVLLKVGHQALNLHFAGREPNVNSGAQVQVSGVLVGSEMAVANIVNLSAPSAGFTTILPYLRSGANSIGRLRAVAATFLVGICLLVAFGLRATVQWKGVHLLVPCRQFALWTAALAVVVSNPGASYAQTCSLTTGPQKTLVLLATLPGVAPPATQQQVSDIFFGTATGHALDGFWKEASHGQTSATGDIFGWYTLTGSYSYCTVGAAFNEAMTQAAAAGVNFQNYSRIFFVFPGTIGCGWAGVTGGCTTLSTPSGPVTASLSYIVGSYLANRDQGVELVAHEGGHQLGLDHAGTINDEPTAVIGPATSPGNITEFNDFFNTMGGWTLGLYSAPQRSRVLNWMAVGTGYQLVQASGTYVLQPLETSPPGLQALKIQRGTSNTTGYLWVEYRQPIGNYDSTISFMNFAGALVHYEDPTTGAFTHVLDFTPSDVGRWYNTVLGPGQTWTDAYSNVSISVVSATSSGLTVNVSYGSVPCSAAAPAVSLSPLDPSIYAGQTASYSVTVTNNDSSGCSSSTINLGSSQPAGWTTSLSAPSVTLSPGQSASVSMGKGAPSGTAVGTYGVNLTASSTVSTGTGTANATVMASPSLAVSISTNATTFTPPSTVSITAAVTNGGGLVSGANVNFSLTAPNGGITTQTATTGSNGGAVWNYKFNAKSPAGTYLVTAQAAASSGTKKTANTVQTAVSSTATFVVQ